MLIVPTLTAVLLAATLQSPTLLDFLGFSKNRQLCAWHIEVDKKISPRWTDSYRLIRIESVGTGEPVATYRFGPIIRRGTDGKRSLRKQQQLIRAHPSYLNALPKSQWLRLKKQGKFRHRILSMQDSVIRIVPDPDSPLTAQAQSKSIMIESQGTQALGFRIIARRWDGVLMSVGHHRQRLTHSHKAKAKLRVFFDDSGYHLAALTHFTQQVDGGRMYKTSHHSLSSFTRAPVASLDIHPAHSIAQNLRVAKGIFEFMHSPDKTLYNHFVSDGWY
jgi:hypothetical protein